MQECPFRSSIRPSSLTCECFHTATRRLEHSVLQLPLNISNQQIQFACLGDVDVGHDVVSEVCVVSVDESALKLLDHFIQLNVVQLRVIPEHTIRGAALTEVINHKLLELGIIITLQSNAVETIIIANPQSNIPGLIIAPAVVGLRLKLGLEGGGHVCSSQHG